MKLLVSVCVALALASLPIEPIAQVTQIYQYDANGRLTGVATAGLAGTSTAAYAYDDADNRISRSQTGTTAYATFTPQAYDTLRPFSFSSPLRALTFDALFLAPEGGGEVVFDGWAETGPHKCTGTELSLSGWPQVSTDRISGEPAATAAWSSHTFPAASTGFLDGGGEEIPSTVGPSRWSVGIGGEGCPS